MANYEIFREKKIFCLIQPERKSFGYLKDYSIYRPINSAMPLTIYLIYRKEGRYIISEVAVGEKGKAEGANIKRVCKWKCKKRGLHC